MLNKACVYIYHRKDVLDPVSVLKIFQMHFLIGRQLELDNDMNESETLEGETLGIFVSRDRIVESGFNELLEPGLNFRLPLDVTFYGEEAPDLGGPRKEFFSCIMKQMTLEEHRLFIETNDGNFILSEDTAQLDKRWFYAAGLVCGMYGHAISYRLIITQLNNRQLILNVHSFAGVISFLFIPPAYHAGVYSYQYVLPSVIISFLEQN